MSIKPKKKELTTEQYEEVIELLNTNWELKDVPLQDARLIIPELHREHDLVGVMCSGTIYDDQAIISHSIECKAGFDVFCRESRPKQKEPEGNGYHFIVFEDKITGKKYISGPYDKGMRVGHWFDYGDLDNYEV